MFRSNGMRRGEFSREFQCHVGRFVGFLRVVDVFGAFSVFCLRRVLATGTVAVVRRERFAHGPAVVVGGGVARSYMRPTLGILHVGGLLLVVRDFRRAVLRRVVDQVLVNDRLRDGIARL